MKQEEIKQMLIKHEGMVCSPYKCSEGFLTLGVGRNLDANGISEDEAMYLLDNDIKRVIESLNKNWGAWMTQPSKARMVSIDCTFQMGITGWMAFRHTRALMEMGCWLEASEEILRSKYAIQTPSRAAYNSRQLALCGQDGKDIRRPSK
jgi:lysozyme|tara:strand:- start:496 stop:942 length:447 start_codon:yes stop_codon:yes gene_type:complete